MPIFVQWEWKGRTKSFLVIFHFYDDFSKPNLRMKMKKYDLTPDDLDLLELLMDEDKIKELKKLLKDGRPIYIS